MKRNIIIFLIIFICFVIGAVYVINKSNIGIKAKNIKKIGNYNNPIIPSGFEKVETADASWELVNGIPKGWNDGLVIEDEIGNQFVWVPVNIYDEEYSKLANEKKYYYNKDNMNVTVKDEKQILEYGGFYVARYEAGIAKDIKNITREFSAETNNVDGIPTSRKNELTWNYISWSQAKKNSVQMYENSESVESNLLTAKQLGSLYYWLNKAGYDTENNANWGNYSNVNFRFTGYYSINYGKTYEYAENKLKSKYNMLLSTGATERNKSNNIYDLAGNVMEYIDVIENYIEDKKILSYCVIGGYYDNISDYYVMNAYGNTSKQGFRVVLYNK